MILYHNPRCSKSRAALALLQERNISPTIVEYLKHPLDKSAVFDLLAKLGLPAKAVLRIKEAREAGIDPEGAESILVQAIVDHPAILERPILVVGDRAVIGRPTEALLTLLPA